MLGVLNVKFAFRPLTSLEAQQSFPHTGYDVVCIRGVKVYHDYTRPLHSKSIPIPNSSISAKGQGRK